jgi:hypothetical protein
MLNLNFADNLDALSAELTAFSSGLNDLARVELGGRTALRARTAIAGRNTRRRRGQSRVSVSLARRFARRPDEGPSNVDLPAAFDRIQAGIAQLWHDCGLS